MNINMIAQQTDETETTTNLTLVKNGKPTITFIALAAAELTLDVAIGLGVYFIAKRFGK